MKEGGMHWQNKYRLQVDIVVQQDNFICQHNAHFQLNSFFGGKRDRKYTTLSCC